MVWLELDQRDPEGKDTFLSVEPREDVPCLHILFEEHWLCLTHLTIQSYEAESCSLLGFVCIILLLSLCVFLLSSLAIFANQ